MNDMKEKAMGAVKAFLERKGYEIVDEAWQGPEGIGGIDLVAETQATLPASAAPSGSRAAPQCGHVLGSGSSKESPAARACSRVMSPARSIGRPFLIF